MSPFFVPKKPQQNLLGEPGVPNSQIWRKGVLGVLALNC
ncbi:hypothetical protein PPHE_a1301 [Pseudoalteromonas phenolica O-BC30]|nr:hypothetical protein [Pseudoalteromonas phenolica O-BC30]